MLFRRCDLARGSVSVGSDFEVSKPPAVPSTLSLLPVCGIRNELSACCSSHHAFTLLPHFFTRMDSDLSGTVSLNKRFLLQEVPLVTVF